MSRSLPQLIPLLVYNLGHYSRQLLSTMAYWFHRNPLKATAKVNFELKLIVNDSQAIEICRCAVFLDLMNFRNYLKLRTSKYENISQSSGVFVYIPSTFQCYFYFVITLYILLFGFFYFNFKGFLRDATDFCNRSLWVLLICLFIYLFFCVIQRLAPVEQQISLISFIYMLIIQWSFLQVWRKFAYNSYINVEI